MYLSNLKLNGFKSFAEPSIIDFKGGITVVIGPNGCGKTNILDSLRWVLGEQKSSLLRGEKMEEVIFNGTANMKPLGMAEVSLEVNNSDGSLPLDYNNVLITRRLYRSGESEYLLNKKSCRLKDISHLLLNTGLGPRAYSVIEQSMIEALISGKTDDRRFLFEEAAGVSGYKLRRHETLRKLETISSDLMRIVDITSEVEKQATSLKRQSSKAERYKQHNQHLKELSVQLLACRYITLKSNIHGNREEKSAISDEISSLKAKIAADSVNEEKIKSEISEIKEALNTISSELNPVASELIEYERRFSINEERTVNINNNIERLNNELSSSEKQIQELIEQEEELKAKVIESARRIEEDEKRYSELDDVALNAENELDEKRKILVPIRERLEKASSDLASATSNYDTLKSRQEEYQSQIELLKIRKQNISERAEDTYKRKSDSENAKKGVLANIDGLNSEKKVLGESLKTVSSNLMNSQNKMGELSNSRSTIMGRLDTLRELKSSYEGFREGSRMVLNSTDKVPGIIGTLVEKLNIPEQYFTAVEAAFGQDAELICCNSPEDAYAGIDFINQMKKGVAGFLIENSLSSTDLLQIPESISSREGYEGRLSDKFDQSEFSKYSRILFGNVILMNNRDAALQASQYLIPGLSIVTNNGDYYRWGGIIGGGDPGVEGSIVGRETAINRLESELNQTDSEIKILSDQISDITAEEMKFKTRNSDVDNEIAVLLTKVNQLEREISSLDSDREHLEENEGALNSEISNLESKLESTIIEFNSAGELRNKLTSEHLNIKSELSVKTEDLEKAETEFRDLTREVNQIRVAVLTSQGENKRLDSELLTNSQLQQRLSDNIEKCETDLKQSSHAILELNDEREELQSRIKQLGDQKEKLELRLNEIRGDLAERDEVVNKIEGELSELRSNLDELKSQEHNLDVTMTEADSDLRHIKQKALEEYGIDVTSQEPPLEEFDPEEVNREIIELDAKIQRMGAVNMLALEQYTKAQDRYDFLNKQQDDLTESRDSLKSVIKEINKTASEKILTTFELIRQNFKNIYSRLFEGGEADIQFIDVMNPLESPIEIVARPKGKKILSLAQLSGGERALTSIALLFSIYFVKPAPFCILDEIDAPLDDNNLKRYLRLIKEFSKKTQFICITHNKLTMEAADTLYGVTMEKPGVSKLVSVHFGDINEEEFEIIKSAG
ncbi:MAG: chromosome segregation protein SMC [candidate division Zixibacteria bacterium]|nr:chromosome segregation protein SMC [candidate division Zixibacteria bacterium]